ncbi:MAG: hypothetical protein FGF53_03740 [Candidatus Brockarchaeota archaeon]|nr:hypothetical protein [Candidatus Brockarchaeota archaeon]MBO3840805.1 hypothetical protein [Candidatus Brockarchaeota archaeon]
MNLNYNGNLYWRQLSEQGKPVSGVIKTLNSIHAAVILPSVSQQPLIILASSR